MNNQVRIILADDHQMLREGFKTMLSNRDDIIIVAEAEDGNALLKQVESTQPDVVVTDVKMPNMDGIEACQQIHQSFPQIGIIALSTYDNDHFIIDMVKAGARGYLLKNTDRDELVRAIFAVHAGKTYYCDHIAGNFRKLLTDVRNIPVNLDKAAEFSPREIDIIKLTAQEYTSKEIANVLNLSTRTVENHKERMQVRIEAKNMIGVIMYAIKHNLIRVSEV